MSEEYLDVVTSAVREADRIFDKIGGSSRHWVRECFFPALEKRSLHIVLTRAFEPEPCGHPAGARGVVDGVEMCLWCAELIAQKAAVQAALELRQRCDSLLTALEPFAYLADVLEPGNVLNFRGIYITYDEVQAAAAAIAKAKGEA